MSFTPHLIVTLVVVALSSFSVHAGPIPDFNAVGARLQAMWKGFTTHVQESIIKNNPFFSTVHDSLRRVDEQYKAAKATSEYEQMDKAEQENLYLKIALDELRNVRTRMQQSKEESSLKGNKVMDAERRKLNNELEKIEQTSQAAHVKLDKPKDEPEWNPDTELMDEEEEAKKLAELSELEETEHQKAMGWAISLETQKSIEKRTRTLLVDLISNEIKIIALWMLENAMTGGSQGDIANIGSVINGLRMKVVEYVFNVIRDIMNDNSGFETGVEVTQEKINQDEEKREQLERLVEVAMQ